MKMISLAPITLCEKIDFSSIYIILHLPVVNFIFFVATQSVSPQRIIFTVLKHFAKLLMKKLKNTSIITDPYGSPLVSSSHSKKFLSVPIIHFLPFQSLCKKLISCTIDS